MITDAREMIEYLENLSNFYPQHIIKEIKAGTKVKKSSGITYVIPTDSPNVGRIGVASGELPKGSIPYGAINRGLRDDKAAILNVIGDRNEISISELYDRGLGECLEKAVLVHLYAQRGRRVYTIIGYMTVRHDDGTEPVTDHSYNVVVKDGKPFLVDAQNPVNCDGKTVPYIAKIKGIDEAAGVFILDKPWGDDRREYSIF